MTQQPATALYPEDWDKGGDDPTDHEPDPKRQGYIDGLRALATVLATCPEVPLPYDGDLSPMSFYFLGHNDRHRREMAAAARAIPCAWAKVAEEGDNPNASMSLHGQLAGLRITLTAYRDVVCTRRVTGTEDREVEEEVTPAVTRKVTKPVEIVEWDCGSLLAPPRLDGGAS
jgi:hypothetical protein